MNQKNHKRLSQSEKVAIEVLFKKKEDFYEGHKYDAYKDWGTIDEERMAQNFDNICSCYSKKVSGMINYVWADKAKAMSTFIKDFYDEYLKWKKKFLQKQSRFPLQDKDAILIQVITSIKNECANQLVTIDQSIFDEFLQSVNQSSCSSEQLTCSFHGINTQSCVLNLYSLCM